VEGDAVPGVGHVLQGRNLMRPQGPWRYFWKREEETNGGSDPAAMAGAFAEKFGRTKRRDAFVNALKKIRKKLPGGGDKTEKGVQRVCPFKYKRRKGAFR